MFPALISLELHFHKYNRLLGKFSWINHKHFPYAGQEELTGVSVCLFLVSFIFPFSPSNFFFSFVLHSVTFGWVTWGRNFGTTSESFLKAPYSNSLQVLLTVRQYLSNPLIYLSLHLFHSLSLKRVTTGIWACYGLNCIPSNNMLRF